MKLQRIISLTLAAGIALLSTGCGQKIQDNEALKSAVSPQKPEQSAQDDTDDASGEAAAVSEKTITPNEIPYVKYSKTYQAESGTLTGKAKVGSARDGFKGEGYVTGLYTEEDSWELTFELTDSQYYNITLAVATGNPVKNTVTVNGASIGEFLTAGSGKFETVTFENIYIEKGYAKISVPPVADRIDIDYVKVTASDEISKLDLGLKNASLVNKNADYKTRALYKYLCDNFGRKVILGQHDSVGSVTETSAIYEVTGRYPAIRFGDLMPFTQDSTVLGENEIELAESWAESGGIVSYMWHWTDPMGSGEYYSDKTDFDVDKAVTKEDIALKSLDELTELHDDGKISDECLAIIEDIDRISEKLGELQDAGIPVLWRPLHEASNGYFWWGKDADSYLWLWKLLYERQTNYHELNNLIWVWSAQNEAWYVGDDYCDILSVDIYDQGNYSGQINRLLFLHKLSGSKPAAISECGNFPAIQNIADEKAEWSYIGQWGGNFLLSEDGSINEEYNTKESLIEIYNNNLTVTRDKLPDFQSMADRLKQDEENAEIENRNTASSDKDGEDSGKDTDESQDDSPS
ncbi:glycosyl hydrolase [Ruminococcus sp. Marseille-P6503]|uniref:glycosyl hydrolase n=1 Tax=Ruminococcus sp. Marseille-P6503 TaxID=2364796 RepID=UPI000F5204EF|nr:glycosyl hydrolase [Ruminococcus sp. Marseille-P6503]